MYGRGETGVLGSSRPEHSPCLLLRFLFCKGICFLVRRGVILVSNLPVLTEVVHVSVVFPNI